MIREKLYRDPIHDLIALDKNSPQDCVLMQLIDSPEMQRLRRIRQLGLASFAYQGAEHSRFTHSLGAMWVATRILNQLGKERHVAPRLSFATRCAALLHDVGHGPLSHVFESFMGVHHETWTRQIILDRTSAIHNILRSHHAALPGEVVQIIEGESKPAYLSQIISSQLDADRFDYLLRDSASTGVKYGIYDLERLLHVLRLDPRGETILVAANGVQAVEKYLQARYHMYSQVYLHKTVRAAECVFGKLLIRAADLIRKNQLPGISDQPLGRLLLQRGKATLVDYTQVDDYVIFANLNQWCNSEDSILRDLSQRIVQRNLFKTIDVSRVNGLTAKMSHAKKIIKEARLDPKYYLSLDTSGDTPYRPYDPRLPGHTQHIQVENPNGAPRDIVEHSEVVRGLARAAFSLKRVMFPANTKGCDIRAAMNNLFLDQKDSETFLPPW